MRKLKKLLIVMIGMIPVICNAQVEKEVNYRWYTLVEDNIHYESNAEDVCEYYDKDDIRYSNWMFSLVKPEEKDYRVIKEEVEDINIRKDNFNILQITYFKDVYEDFSVLELNIYDKDNNLIKNELTNYFAGGDINNIMDNDLNTSVKVNPHSTFTYEFDNLIDVRNVKIVIKYSDEETTKNFDAIDFAIILKDGLHVNSFGIDKEIIDTKCSDGVCVKEITVKEDAINEDIVFKGKVYRYQDKFYKCYDMRKLYVPGYYSNLEGFIKDENDYIEIVRETKVETEVKNIDNSNNNVDSEDIMINDDVQDDSTQEEDKEIVNVEDTIKDVYIDKPIAMVTNDKTNDRKSVVPYVLMLVVLFMVSVLAFFAKKVVNSRTK